MAHPEYRNDKEHEYYSELDNGNITEDEDICNEKNSFGHENGSDQKKKKNKREKGPPIVCLMCKTVWTKSRRGGRLFMFGGTRPFMAKFEAKFKALMGQEELSALQKKSATKFGRSYICRECYLMVRQTYDNIRRLQRNVSKSIKRTLEGPIYCKLKDIHESDSDLDLEINLQAHNTPKKKLPPVAERIAEKIANLTLVKINNKIPFIVLQAINMPMKDGHNGISGITGPSPHRRSTDVTECPDIPLYGQFDRKKPSAEKSLQQKNSRISLEFECELHRKTHDEVESDSVKESCHMLVQEPGERLQSENVSGSKEVAASLNLDTSFVSQHLMNNNIVSEADATAAKTVENGRMNQIDTIVNQITDNNISNKELFSKSKPCPSELAEVLANPLLLIKCSQPVKLSEVKNNNVYICGEDGCDWIFSSRFFWENHIRHYHRCGKPFICPFEGCGRSFTGRSKLELHIRSHTDERPFICDKCGSGFRGNQELRAHRLTHTSEKPHQCPKCDKNFKLLSSLKRHLQFHDGGEFPFPCTYPECEKAFKSRYDLKCHYRLHTGERPYRCPEPGCGMAFRIPCQFTMHKRSHTGERPFRCPEVGCSAAYISSNALQAHMLSHTSERPFCCEFCGKTFKHKMLYRMHLKKHSGSQCFLCPAENCGEEFADRRSMDQHMAANHGVQNCKQQNKKTYMCSEEGCGLKYSTDGGLQYHQIKVHKQENAPGEEEPDTRKLICPYDKCQRHYEDSDSLHDHLAKAHIPMPREKMCSLCGMAFPYMEQLNQHKNSLHNESSMKSIFVCNSERCGVHFRRLDELKHHVTWHLGNPPYRCEYEECGRTFLLESMLTKHVMEHDNRKPFTCSFDHCNDGFTSHIKVLKHSKIHFGLFRCPIDGCSKAMQTLSSARTHLLQHEKPYVCALCGKRFSSSPQWIKHKRSHTGEKVYECKVCSCQFPDSESLKDHKRVHKGEKQYICEECGQTFGSQVSYKNHMKTHSRELPYTCQEEGCGKAFRESSSLKAHMNVHSKPSHLCTQCGKVYKFSISKHKCNEEPEVQIASGLNVEFIQHQPSAQHKESAPSSLLQPLTQQPPPPPSVHLIAQPIPQSIPQSLPQTVPQSIVQPVSQPLTQSLSQSLPQPLAQTLSQSVPQSVPQSILPSLSHYLPQTLPQSLPQHPPPQHYMSNMMVPDPPPQSYMMEVEEAARAMRQNFGTQDTIVVDPAYYNYIILYDKPVQQ